MRKGLFSLFIIVIGILLLSGCREATKPEGTITSAATTAITTVTGSILSLFERVAKLIKEDGTGTISIGMDRSEVLMILNEKNIPYSMIAHDIELGDSEYFGQGAAISGGTYYSFDFATMQLNSIYPMRQSFCGLKVGDSVQRVLDLYGKPDIYDNTDMGDFYHYLSLLNDGTVYFTVRVFSDGDTAMVNEMSLTYRTAEEMAEQ